MEINLDEKVQNPSKPIKAGRMHFDLFRFSGGQWAALLSVIAVYLVGVAILYRNVMKETSHLQPYLLDDTYIQAAMGRNLAFYHTYGVSPGVFSTASSSIIWPFLLALTYKIFGLHLLLPLLLNAFLGVVLIAVVVVCLRWFVPKLPSWAVACALFAAVAAAPLWTLTFIAMEHILFAVASLLLFSAASLYLGGTHKDELLNERRGFNRNFLLPWLYISAFLSCGARFEGAFLVFFVCLALLARKRIVSACITAGSGLFPILVFSLTSLHYGAMYMPNSLMMKAGRKSEFASYGFMNPSYGIIGRYALSQGIGQLFLAALFLLLFFFIFQRSMHKSNQYGLMLFVCTCLLHSKLARMGWLYRYESYLVVIGIVIVTASLYHLVATVSSEQKMLRASCVAVGVVVGLSITPLATRSQEAYLSILPAAKNVYTQQYQMAQFVHRYHDRDSIVINDVGAITYFTHGKIIDLAGLASNDVAKLIVERKLDPDTVEQLARQANATVALVFKSSFFSPEGGRLQGGIVSIIPPWTDVGRLDGFQAISPVYVLAIHPKDAPRLSEEFKEFAKQVPPQTAMTPFANQPDYNAHIQ